MRASWMLLVTVGLALVLPAAGVSAKAPPVQLNYEAAVFNQEIRTSDPCVVYGVSVDVLDFVLRSQTTKLYDATLRRHDLCAGEGGWTVVTPVTNPIVIDDSAFVVSPSHDAADLRVTIDGWNSVSQSVQPLTLALHWASTGVEPSDGSARVTGTMNSGDLVATLDDPIVWNRWGSNSFPWAGLWLCRFSAEPSDAPTPGCLRQ